MHKKEGKTPTRTAKPRNPKLATFALSKPLY
jgi:hypothetical protein